MSDDIVPVPRKLLEELVDNTFELLARVVYEKHENPGFREALEFEIATARAILDAPPEPITTEGFEATRKRITKNIANARNRMTCWD